MRVIRLNRPDWMDEAACRGGDPAVMDLFFPTNQNQQSRRAREICARCEVRPDCLRWALERPELQGIWGGATQTERDRLRRDRAC